MKKQKKKNKKKKKKVSSSSKSSPSYSLIQQAAKLQLLLQYGIDKYEYELNKHS